MNSNHTDMFERTLELPNPDADRELAGLVGVDDVIDDLTRHAGLLLDPDAARRWSKSHHDQVLPAVKELLARPPLVVLAGDVGVGKTTLAETFGTRVAREHKLAVRVLRLSLRARGRGAVGEMTTLLGEAFDAVITQSGTPGSATILVIDEADALAQSRAASQMHHEDRAGVNALIRGIDEIADADLPVLVVMCTNRLSAIDPAVLRRAAATFELRRPDGDQRREVITSALDGVDLSPDTLDRLVDLTGGSSGTLGFTYSDLRTRLVPGIVLACYPDRPIDDATVLEVAARTTATPAFVEGPADG